MAPGTGHELVRNIIIDQFMMQVFIYLVKEVLGTTVNYERQTVWRQQVHQIDHRILFPYLTLFGVFTESFLQNPPRGERSDVYTAAHTACYAKNILMLQSKVQGTMTTHAESGDAATFTVFDGFILTVHPGDQLF
jgi:hypothetical protein